jgi:hypothetical protein
MTDDVVRFEVIHVIFLVGSVVAYDTTGLGLGLGLGIVIVGAHDVDVVHIRVVDGGRQANQVSRSDMDRVLWQYVSASWVTDEQTQTNVRWPRP